MNMLETERLIVRPFGSEDLDAAHRLLDRDLQWSGPSFSREQRRQRLQFYADLAEWADSGRLYGYRAIILKQDTRLIGLCGFVPCLWTPDQKVLLGRQFFEQGADDPDITYSSVELEVGYALSPGYRGQGYATEAVRAVITHAFKVVGIQRIVATTDHGNAGSINMMKRLGMFTRTNPQPVWPGVVGILENRMPPVHRD